MRKSIFVNIASLFAGIGFIDSLYLASEHYFGKTVVCAFLNGCDKVLNNAYATFYGLPISYIGVGYYALLMGLVLLYILKDGETTVKLFAVISGTGFIISFFLFYVQLFLIKALCLYCLISFASTTILFLISLLFCTQLILNKRLGIKVG